MRASLETHLNDIWYRPGPPPWYLSALEPAYRAALALDKKRASSKRAEDLEGRCIIVVGNLTAGGSGKTPCVVHLCALLRQAGLKPGVISRGYGRKDTRQRLVTPDSDPALVGDEPLLIARRTKAPVVVDNDRAAAARRLFAEGANVAISDDGLQHHALPRAIEICVVDGLRGLGNGHLLPAGPLREDPARLRHVDHVVINGMNENWPGVDCLGEVTPVHMDVQARKVINLNDGMSWRLSQFAGCKVHAVAGIANPQRFFELLRQARIEVQEHVYPDHHAFSHNDFEGFGDDIPIIMTEKDAVKVSGFKLEHAWFLAVDAVFPSPWEQLLLEQVRKNLDDH